MRAESPVFMGRGNQPLNSPFINAKDFLSRPNHHGPAVAAIYA